jgi:tetratricopeptide (TPR) repeat protein
VTSATAKASLRPAPVSPGTAELASVVRLELGDTELHHAAPMLTRLLRGLSRWAEGSYPVRFQRPGLFRCRPLREAVSCLQLYLRSPGTSELRAQAAEECRAAATCLERHGALRTATAFAEAACALEPHESSHALAVGRLACVQERGGAGTWAWCRWAAYLARRAGDANALSTAFTYMGEVADQEDRHALAGRLFHLARSIARRHALKDQEGEALVALGLMRYPLGHTTEALDHFRTAVDAFGPGSRRLAMAGLRIGECWLEAGEHQGAAALLLAVIPHATGRETLRAAALAARATGAMRWREDFEATWNAAWQLSAQADARGQVAALLQLARGAASLDEWTRARVTLTAAMHLAGKAKDEQLLGKAARMFAVATAHAAVPEDAIDEEYPDRRRVRLGLVNAWEERDGEPGTARGPVREVVNAFVRAMEQDAGPSARPVSP